MWPPDTLDVRLFVLKVEQRQVPPAVGGEDGGDCGKVHALVLIGGQAGCTFQHRACRLNLQRIAAAQGKIGLQHMGHHEVWRLLQRQ